MKWIYEHTDDNSARFVLGQEFNPDGKTLLCFGINPSTASPEALDPTVNKLVNISRRNGYENWIMLNIYPQRATNPNEMHAVKDDKLIRENLKQIKAILEQYPNCDVLYAYGNLISKREYLKPCLDEITTLINEHGKSLKIIKLTKQNNPTHPLYQPNDTVLVDYNIKTPCAV